MHKRLYLLGLVSSMVLGAGGCGTVTLSNDAGRDGAPDGATGTGGSGSGSGGTGGSGSGGNSGTGGTGSGGNATGGASGSGGAIGTGGGSGSGGAAGHDECRRDSDCPTIMCIKAPCPVNVCVQGLDGFHHCRLRSEPALVPCGGFGDACCTSDDQCTQQPHGTCVPMSYNYCGGAAPFGNQCRYDQCQGDADCTAMPNGFCTDGFPRQCVYGPCRTNADCTAGPGGKCALESVGLYCHGDAVFCSYANDPCHSNADCKGSLQACMPNDNRQGASCKMQPPPPP